MKKFNKIATLLTVIALTWTIFPGNASIVNAAADNSIKGNAAIIEDFQGIDANDSYVKSVSLNDAVVDTQAKGTTNNESDEFEAAFKGNNDSKTYIRYYYNLTNYKVTPPITGLKNKTSKICSAKVVRVGKKQYYAVSLTFKKAGKAKVSYKIGNITYNLTVVCTKINPAKDNPLKSIKVGKKAISGLPKSFRFSGTALSGKLVVTPNPGFSLVGMAKYNYCDPQATISLVENNSKIKMKKHQVLLIVLKNDSNDKYYSYSYISK